MAQVTDRNIGANPTGFDMRAELNNIIAALESDNSGASEPLNTVPYMKWLDTSNATYYYYKERNHDNTAWVTLFRYTVATKIMEVVSNGVVLSQTNIASEIHASSSKTTPVDADEIGLIDSASTFNLKKLTWANLKATLKTYFNTLYQVVLVSGTNIKTINSNSILGSGDLVVSTPIASTAETQAGVDDLRAVTPLKLFDSLKGSNQNLAESGYQKLHGGLIIQWGSALIHTSQGQTFTFPIAFPNKCISVLAIDNTSLATNVTSMGAQPYNNSYFNLYGIRGTTANAAGEFSYMAIGY